MSKRSYTQAKRGEAADATRRRIVEATLALHAEQGIAATSMKQIAARAGVSVGAVYHHFPTYDDAIQACGRLVLERLPPLDASIFDGLDTAPRRIERLVSAQFAQHAQLPVLEVARADRQVSPALEQFLAEEQRNREALAAEALAPAQASPRAAAALAALVDIGVWRALVSAGFETAEAARLIASLARRGLEDGTLDPP